MDVVPLVDSGLGNSAYLVDLGDGRALAVDVSRDLREVHHIAEKRGWRLAFAADTHLHADFLSGARQLAATEGARVLASAAGEREFEHTGLHDGDEVDLGGLRLRVLSTPGHTHEHVSFLLLDGDRPAGVFTGGSLIVGAAARTDLVSPDQTVDLARRQFSSLRRLRELPDDLAVWPTHGAGSFCSAPPGAERTSTIGREKATNSLLRAESEEAFVAELLGSLGSYPTYFGRLAEINRRGPTLLGDVMLSPLDAIPADAVVVDTRPIAEFAAGHIPGSLSIALRPTFASWLGWLVPADRPVVIVRGEDQDPAEIAWQAAKIGHDNLIGEFPLRRWTGGLSRTRLIGPGDVHGERVLDVRQDNEWAAGHRPDAVHVELGDLAGHELPKEPTVVMCAHGERAMSGASVLERSGHHDLAVVRDT